MYTGLNVTTYTKGSPLISKITLQFSCCFHDPVLPSERPSPLSSPHLSSLTQLLIQNDSLLCVASEKGTSPF